jgi:hypothetical protein
MRSALLGICVALAGCATPVIMLRNDQTGQIARCGGGSTGAMALGMFGKNLEQESDERCARDYEQQGFARTSATALAGTPPRQAAPIPAVAPRAALGESKWLITAEGVAKANACQQPATMMVSKGAGEELFAVDCQNGTTLAVRCQIDGCRVLR